jgi:hypothetical protein
MKHLKTVAALAAATGLMVLIAAGTASADVLCKNGTTTNACTEPYEAGTTLSATVTGSSVISDTSANTLDSCSGGTMKASVTNPGGASALISASITEQTWSGCTVKADTIKLGELTIEYVKGTDNGTVRLKGNEVTVNVFSSCNYGPAAGAETDIGTLTGAKGATLAINAVLKKLAGGFLCPETVKWVATYKFNTPESLFVAAA